MLRSPLDHGVRQSLSAAHSRASGNQGHTITLLLWVPAFAGTNGPLDARWFNRCDGDDNTTMTTVELKPISNEMSPDLFFLLTLIVKMAITAGFVVAATVTAERVGPLLAGLVATLPIGAGPVYVFLALDHDAHFIAQGALAASSSMQST